MHNYVGELYAILMAITWIDEDKQRRMEMDNEL